MPSLFELVQQSRQRGSISPSSVAGDSFGSNLSRRAEAFKSRRAGELRQEEFDTLFASQQAAQQASFEEQTRQANMQNIIKSLSGIPVDKLRFVDFGGQFDDISKLGLSAEELQRGIGPGFRVFQDESGIAHRIEVGSLADRASAYAKSKGTDISGLHPLQQKAFGIASQIDRMIASRRDLGGLNRVQLPEEIERRNILAKSLEDRQNELSPLDTNTGNLATILSRFRRQ